MVELLSLLGSLGAFALILLAATGAVRLARHRPWTVSILIGVGVGLGAGAIVYAAAEGFGYRPDSQRVEFGSNTGRQCFSAGFALLTFGCPAWLLVIVGRVRNGAVIGPRGVLYMWLTGYTK